MCAYDLDRLELPLTFSLSKVDDVFLGIGMKQPKKLEENLPGKPVIAFSAIGQHWRGESQSGKGHN